MCEYILDRTEAKNPSLSVIGTPLHGAARNLEVCKLIMENVKDNNDSRNPSNEFGNTPLHFAARHSALKLEKNVLFEEVEYRLPQSLKSRFFLIQWPRKGLRIEENITKNRLFLARKLKKSRPKKTREIK